MLLSRGNVEDPKDPIVNPSKGGVMCRSLKNVIYTKKKNLGEHFLDCDKPGRSDYNYQLQPRLRVR